MEDKEKDTSPLVSPNVKITVEQREQLRELGKQTNNRYSDTFRLCLTLGIIAFKQLQINVNNDINE